MKCVLKILSAVFSLAAAVLSIKAGGWISVLFFSVSAFLLLPLPKKEKLLEKRGVKGMVPSLLAVLFFFSAVALLPASELTVGEALLRQAVSDAHTSVSSLHQQESTSEETTEVSVDTRQTELSENNGTSEQTEQAASDSPVQTESESAVSDSTDSESAVVYRTPSGQRYHYSSACGGQNSYSVQLSEAISAGLTPCMKCAQ